MSNWSFSSTAVVKTININSNANAPSHLPHSHDFDHIDNCGENANTKNTIHNNNPASLATEFGAISPCEMNEFSDECEAWEAENGPYEKGQFMVKSNERTKGR